MCALSEWRAAGYVCVFHRERRVKLCYLMDCGNRHLETEGIGAAFLIGLKLFVYHSTMYFTVVKTKHLGNSVELCRVTFEMSHFYYSSLRMTRMWLIAPLLCHRTRRGFLEAVFNLFTLSCVSTAHALT